MRHARGKTEADSGVDAKTFGGRRPDTDGTAKRYAAVPSVGGN